MAPTTVELFEAAVALHTRRLMAIARAIAGNRASAEDVVQQALTNLYQHRDRYNWIDPVGAGPLLRRAVVNEALRLLRQPRMSEVPEDHPAGSDARQVGSSSRWAANGSGSGGGLGRMIDRETIVRVRQAIDRLPEHFRAALVLCEYENMPYAQIADALGASVPQVKTWLHRGRRQLAVLLEDFMAPARPKPTLTSSHEGKGDDEARGAGRRRKAVLKEPDSDVDPVIEPGPIKDTVGLPAIEFP